MRAPVLCLVALALSFAGAAAEEGGGMQAPKAEAEPAEPALPPVKLDYCANFAVKAEEARIAWQKKELTELEARLDAKIALLEQKRGEYLEWRKQREAEVAEAEQGLVQIYAKMRPDVAAEQLALLDLKTAAAILRKLTARNASAILNEMRGPAAAELTKILAQSAPQPPQGPSQ